MKLPDRRLLWTGAAFLLGCGGILLGNTVRDNFESGGNSLVPSEVYATMPARDDQAIGTRSAGVYFEEIRKLLSREFVEPVSDQRAMTHGTLQGLLQQLGDPLSRFYKPDEWDAYISMFEGRYYGIGADLVVIEEQHEDRAFFPVRIVSVVEGGPAHTAGLRTGDHIDELNSKWIASRSLFHELDQANRKRERGEMTQEQFDGLFEELRARSESMISSFAALRELQIAKSGDVNLTVLRGGERIEVKVARRTVQVQPVERVGDAIRIRSFAADSAAKLRSLIGVSVDITLDLRGNPGGSYDAMTECLAELMPSGAIAKVRRREGRPLEALEISKGAAPRSRVTVMVDGGTAREAEVFVAALRDRIGATVVGGPTYGLAAKVERFQLVDGSGYTLTSGLMYDLNDKPLYREGLVAKSSRDAGEVDDILEQQR